MRSLFLSLIVLLCIGSCTPLNSGVTLTGQVTEEIFTTFRPCQGCGNGKCDYPSENCVTCPDDCGKCAPCVVKCGNGICDGNETACNCPEDCGACCLDGVCNADGGETYANCADCSANLNVTVVDSLTYNPLPGSVVQCTSTQFPIGPLTSESGEFSFKKIPSGLYTCTATRFTYTPNVVTFSVLSSFKNMTVRIPLTQEKGTVEGVTYDLATNEPLTNTRVSCSNGTYHTDNVLTDKFGQFVFADVAPGYWVCTGSREGYQTTSNDGTLVSGGLVRIDLILRSIPASVQGYVTQNGTNTPIIAPTVVCTQGNLSKTFVGNEVGFYVTDNVDPAFISCTASRDGYGSETKSAVVGIGQIMVINFTLPVKASILTGDISDSVTGFRISGANVTCVNLDNLTAVADNNGVYSINNIFAGSWNCTAERDGWFPRSSPIQIQPGMPQYLPFVLDPKPASLAGVVVDTTGNPILLASVNCVFTILPNTQPNLGPLSTNSTGNFVFENIIFRSSLVQLAFTCEATKSGFGTGTKTGTLKRGDDAFITIQLILLGIQVTVKDLDSALPVPGATVVCDGPTTSSDTSNAAGITLFDGISLGNYNCSASLTGYTGDSARLTISSSSGIVNLTLNIQLTRYLITGKVIDADDGSALTSASLVIRDGTGTLDLVQVPLNETSAEFKVLLVLPARYNFYAENGINYLPANPFVTLGPNNYSTPLFLRVAAISSTITGEVINNATGASLKNALLDLFSVSGTTTTYLFSATSSDDGTFQFTQVNRGNFKLRVTAEGYLTTESTFTISRLGITVARTVRIDPDIYGRVAGKIVRTLSGGSVVGISGATITLVNIANSIEVFTNTTGADGSYFFAQVPSGRTTATASKEGFKSNTLAFDVTIGTTNSINDIILQPLVGSVVGALYKVFGGTRTACNCFATITIYPTGVAPIPSNAVGSVSVATGNSNYSFPDLAIGQYFLVSQDLTTQQQFRVDNVNVAADTATTVDIQMN